MLLLQRVVVGVVVVAVLGAQTALARALEMALVLSLVIVSLMGRALSHLVTVKVTTMLEVAYR